MDKETWGPLLMVPILVAIVAPIAWITINGRKWLSAHAEQFLNNLFAEVGASPGERQGYVHIRFPIYVGALVTARELTASGWVPQSKSRMVVNRLALYSLQYGLFTIFAPYVLFMVFINYVIHAPKLSSA
jgi:hypothetical protein